MKKQDLKKRITFLEEEIISCHKYLAKLTKEKSELVRQLGDKPSVNIVCVSPEPLTEEERERLLSCPYYKLPVVEIDEASVVRRT